ncbi:MAG: DNA polymerase I [Ignavibacteriaceae bacterium]
MKKLVVVDALALAYKAYFAFANRPLTTKSGEPTSAVFGFVNQIIKIIEEVKADYICVAFDSKEPTFRHEMYDLYKANRSEMPEDMVPQIQRIKDIVISLDFPLLIKAGHEADDLIGALVRRAEARGIESFIASPDKDLLQLITEKTRVVKLDRMTNELEVVDAKRVREKFNFDPIRIIDYLALLGDSSDNIPGVKGIGEKAAGELIPLFGTIENIYEKMEEVPEKFRAKLTAGKEAAFLSKKLATVDIDVPLEIDFDKLTPPSPHWDEVKKIFEELEFRNPYVKLRKHFGQEPGEEKREKIKEERNPPAAEEVRELKTDKPEVVEDFSTHYKLIKNKKDAAELAERLAKESLFVFDTETNSLDTLNLLIAGASFCFNNEEAWFVALNPFTSSGDLFAADLSERLDINDFVKIFKPVFENPDIKKVCQNGKFDIAVLRSVGIEVANFYFDTMIASYIIDPDQKHNMDDLSRKYLGYSPIPLSDLIGKGKEANKIFEVGLDLLSKYAAEDADVTYRLFRTLEKELSKEGLEEVAYKIDFPLVPILEDIENTGVRVDKGVLNKLSGELAAQIEILVKEIYEHAGKVFNINSPQQLQKILYEDLNLATGKKTKTGFSTDARTLETLADTHPIIASLLDYRTVSKLKSTYTDALPKLINPATGRIHTSYNQTIASTGRLSSNEPNLQNIPVRSEFGKEIRRAFVPRDSGHIIVSADYSQIELRIMAHYCGDPRLIEAFANKEDIHRKTAALVFQVSPEEVTPDMRRKAKEVNFGILYGIGAFGLKTRLRIPQNQAKEIIDNYFRTFPGIKDFMNSSIEEAREKGYASTLTGRRRFMKNIRSSNAAIRQFDERAAINMPIQGTAADMIKIAMIKIFHYFRERDLKSKMILQVHDELVFDVLKEELDEVVGAVRELMENAMPLKVPITADVGQGENWLEAH